MRKPKRKRGKMWVMKESFETVFHGYKREAGEEGVYI